MINVAICDDDKEQRDKIHNMCEIYSEMKAISFFYVEFSTGEQVLSYKDNIDILFLDIELPGINGLQVMELADKQRSIKIIVFISGHDKYINDGYSSKTRGFIRKPVVYENLEKCINRILKELISRLKIEFVTDRKLIILKAEEILYLNSIGNYIKLICLDGHEYIIYGSMEDWNRRLMDYGIIRVHKSYIVNLKYIESWDKNLKITNLDKEIPVGKKFFKEGKRKYEDYYLNIMI